MPAEAGTHDTSQFICTLRKFPPSRAAGEKTGAALATKLTRSPDRCPTHPGALLREIIVPALSVSKTSLAKSLGISRQTLYDLLAERQPVTPAMALRLQAAFGRSALGWLNMQLAYDLWHAERTVDVSKITLLQEAS